MMTGLWRDLRTGFRSLVKSPGFTLVALITLALGIGANTAIFSVVNAVLLNPLPYPEPNNLIAFYTTDPRHNQFNGRFSYALYRQLQPAIGSQSKTAAYATWPFTITSPGEPAVVLGLAASSDFFPMLGIRPMLGHLYTVADERAARPAVVISEDLWRKRFQSDPAIIGKTIELDHHPYAILGVLSAKQRFPMLPGTPDVWLPLSSASLGQMLAAISNSLQSALPSQGTGNLSPDYLDVLNVIGRLNKQATPAQVQATTVAVVKNFAKQNPDEDSDTDARVTPLAQEVEKGYRTALLLLFGAVGLVLLIACANVANLLLARVTSREREMALRLALGAGKRRIVRQMLIESIELSLTGGAAGAYLAYFTLMNLGHLIPRTLAEARGASINGHVLAFSAAVSIGAGLLFGSLPVWGIADLNVFETLKEGGRGLSGSGSRNRLRSALVIAEVALAVILLVGSGLLLHSFVRVISVTPGYDPHGVLLAQLNLPTNTYAKPDQWRNYVTTVLSRLRSEPGITAAAVAVTPPVAKERIGIDASYDIAGHPLPPDKQPQADVLSVSPGYFSLMRTPLLRGRAFAETDRHGSAPVCIVSRSLVDAEFGATSPLGQRLSFTKMGTGCEIVGEVGDVLEGSLTAKPTPSIYLPFEQFPFPVVSVLARTSLTPASVTPAIREALHDIGPDIPIGSIDPVEQLLSNTTTQQRFRTLLVGIFAGLAILLAAVGISGVLGYSVSRRRQEIGVRMALGATPREVLRHVLGEGLRLVGVGAAMGLVAAFALTRLMRSLLYGMSPADALTYAGVVLLLLIVALLACALPALRAARVDPNVALRYE
ncbi:MAG: ABC transporter permease [Acidobacteriota bacterium]|nr:ABC transporter permease [Acidobacteriota bacterium]